MRTFFALALLALSASAYAQEKAPSPRPATVDALVETATKAIIHRDVEVFMTLIPNVKEMAQHCPTMVNDSRKREQMQRYYDTFRQKLGQAMDECHKTVDLSKAKRVRTEGGEKDDSPLEGCVSLFKVEDINVYFELDGKRYRLKLDDPFASKGGYGLLDDPRCTAED
jgi:hypothetical protein